MASLVNQPRLTKAGSDPVDVDELPPSRKPPSIPRQLLSNRLSQTGFIILTLFALIALLAPVLAPPLPRARDPMKIPRDGFGNVPEPPGTKWERNPAAAAVLVGTAHRIGPLDPSVRR